MQDYPPALGALSELLQQTTVSPPELFAFLDIVCDFF
jgi:hypothetical protein